MARISPAPAGRWLYFRDDDERVLEAAISDGTGGRLRIGRDPERNDIYLDHPACPPLALVVFERDGVDVVKVYEGARVSVNGAVVQGMHRLYGGDRLRVGDRDFHYGRSDTPPELALGLTVAFGGEVQQATVVRAAAVVLGRSGDVVLNDPSVLNAHARLECFGDGAVFVVPLPHAACWLDDVRIEQRTSLLDGARLQFGRVEVGVRLLPTDGLGLLVLPKRRAVAVAKQSGAVAQADPPPGPTEEVPAVTVMGSLAQLGIGHESVPIEALEDAGLHVGPVADGGRQQHWSTGATPPPRPGALPPAAEGPALSAAARRSPAAPPLADSPGALFSGPSVRVRADLVATSPRHVEGQGRPAERWEAPVEVAASPLADAAHAHRGAAAGGRRVDDPGAVARRRVLRDDHDAPLVPVVRPGLHDAETATLDTCKLPDMIGAHYRALGQPVPQWARTGAYAPPSPTAATIAAPSPLVPSESAADSPSAYDPRGAAADRAPARPRPPRPLAPSAVDVDAPTQQPYRPLQAGRPDRQGSARQSASHEPYRPSRTEGAAGPWAPPAVGHAASPLTQAMAPVPEAPRLKVEPPADAMAASRGAGARASAAVAPQPVVELPIFQGYSHHDPERLGAAEAPPAAPDRPLGPADEARRHHRPRAIDRSSRDGAPMQPSGRRDGRSS